MKVGEKADLIVKAGYAYGEAGCPPTIPANATLTFSIELLSIKDDNRPETDSVSDADLLKSALEVKDEGNAFFKDRKYKDAIEKYVYALDHIVDIESFEALKLKVILYQNYATSANY
jgi:peptidylprolyl isomerase